MRKEIWWIIAEFMALLIIMLPICGSTAYAQASQPYVSINTFKGEDGIEDYIHSWRAGSGDTLEFEVEAFYPDPQGGGDVIQGDQLKLYISGIPRIATPFRDEDCEPSGAEEYICRKTISFDWASGKRTYEIRLYSDAEKGSSDPDGLRAAASDARTLVADTEGAAIKSLSVSPDTVSTGEVQITFQAEDYAVSEGDLSTCVGVETVEFYLDTIGGSPIETYSSPPKECYASGTFPYDVSSLSDGEYKICAVATDYFGQSTTDATDCVDFTVDTSPPEVLFDTLRIEYEDANDEMQPLLYVGDEDIPATIYLDISGQDLDASTIRADFSNLGGPRYLSEPPHFFSSIGQGKFMLKWVNIRMKEIETCSFSISAVDRSGNLMEVDVPCSIGYDTEAPSVEGIVTDAYKDGTYYIGVGTKVTANIREPGAGLNLRRIYMDLSPLTGIRRVQAENCTMKGMDLWECEWTITPIPFSGVYSVAISRESFDDIGNAMGSTYSQDIGVDKTLPVITSINLTEHLGGGEGGTTMGEGVFVQGDTVIIVLEVSDDDVAVANLTEIGGSGEKRADDCWEDAGNQYCEWIIPIEISGPAQATVRFTIEDLTGNIDTEEFTINVSGMLNQTNPNYWGHTTPICYPSADRELTMQVPGGFRVFCWTKLNPVSPRVAVHTMDMQDFTLSCDITELNGEAVTDEDITSYVNSVRLVNNYAGSRDPYFAVKLYESNFEDVESFKIVCGMEIFTKYKEREGVYSYTVYPERENMSMKIEFFDIPYGNLGDAYEEELQSAIDGAEEWSWFMTDWYDFIKTMEDYCQLQSTITAVVALITSITAAVKATGPSGQAFYQSLCTKVEVNARNKGWSNLQKFFDVTCAFVNCKYDAVFQEDSATRTYFTSGAGHAWGIPKPKESLFWSILTVCIPGVAKHTHTMREMYCQKAYCIVNDVAEGWPIVLCDITFNYQECAFIWGQALNSIPYVAVWMQMTERLRALVADPLSILGWVITMLGTCNEAACTAGSHHVFCSVMYVLNMVGKAVGDIELMQDTEDWGESGDGACDMLEEEYGDELDLDFLG